MQVVRRGLSGARKESTFALYAKQSFRILPDALLGDLISFSIGGCWGKENPQDFQCEVAVIRGEDFLSIEQGAYDKLPVRWEKRQRHRRHPCSQAI